MIAGCSGAKYVQYITTQFFGVKPNVTIRPGKIQRFFFFHAWFGSTFC